MKKIFLLIALFYAFNLNAQILLDKEKIIIDQVTGNQPYPSLLFNAYGGLSTIGHNVINMRSYGGTPSNPTTTTNERLLGTLVYSGYDGSKLTQVGRISVRSYGTFTPSYHPVKMYFKVGGDAVCCPIERMTIDGITGNVGIATTDPQSKLQVTNGDVYIDSVNGDKGIIMKSPDGNCWRITIDNNGDLIKTAITCP